MPVYMTYGCEVECGRITLRWTASGVQQPYQLPLRLIHAASSLHLPHDIVAFGKKGMPVVQDLLLLIPQILIFRTTILELER